MCREVLEVLPMTTCYRYFREICIV